MKIETLLKKVRKEKGLKQTEIARQVNISVMTYIRYEAGERVPNVHTAQLIAEALGIENVKDIFPMPQKQKPDGNPTEEPLQQNNSTKKQ